jgi:NAD(P)-dependent dehydrogenase (short-subunit alcohol dehydrogenase family)
MQMHDSVFLITGGASGLGAGTARMLVGGGAKAVLADLKDAEGESLAARRDSSTPMSPTRRVPRRRLRRRSPRSARCTA